MASDRPIDGGIVALAGVKAGLEPASVSAALGTVQEDLDPRFDEYRRQYECVHRSNGRLVFLVEQGHWETVAEKSGLSSRATDAVRRAHEEQLRRIGRRTDRIEEFESALDIREAVVFVQ